MPQIYKVCFWNLIVINYDYAILHVMMTIDNIYIYAEKWEFVELVYKSTTAKE